MELLTQAVFGLFIPLYIALVLFLSQWAFRFFKTEFVQRDKARFVLFLASGIAILFELVRFSLGDSIPELGYYAVILLLNFCFTTTFYEILMKRVFEIINYAHSAPVQSEEQPD
ncbi:hypothetical protein [Leptospira interrogans]|uniref:hypothetical protein n=1 Tax=Leptospira interrogans TaxID=173 RepID=UPI0002BF4D26|nr:hypothetical protein [Leptospira interrogans]EMJ52077.1 hypothetical protein LEP1GSC013_1000 [Leptospira interrogans serovar Valbuzzi str. Duyster]EMJ53694.1 hypothetical protein LEP1GSC013_1739 [Leptospira interrogans serovar Valbuzzi str. Duyster]EMJ54808.1 hypothetical protein LEP1GSC013_2498 [Leptospira interrogans serovar Valbuzzi str. Duyster]EMJ54836.1 hypothetical protein LEP1GSC013_2537 [Leptospira interrogans serovar Valbuzzi str. Duyster]EMJ55378.1 hypothetical protein LEP1GSC013